MRMFRLCIFAGLCVAGAMLHARTITVAADPWCPFNCIPGSSRQGYMVDLLAKILAPHGYAVKYIALPWSRAIRSAEHGDIDGVVAAGEEDGARLLLHKTPMGVSMQAFATRIGESFEWNGTASLGARRVEVIKNYDYGDAVNQWITQNPRQVEYATGESPLETSFKKVLARRSDVVINNGSVMAYTLKQMDLLEAFTMKPTGNNVPLYIGLSNKIKDAQAISDLINNGIANARKSGELAVLLQKYGLSDWDVKAK
jgi:polar amino acid transport system substrate-binding protein